MDKPVQPPIVPAPTTPTEKKTKLVLVPLEERLAPNVAWGE
jgi:hypothetical protein